VPVTAFRASGSSGLVGSRVCLWSACGQYAFCFINAALRLISGDGELENGWKRLFGSSKGRPEVSGTGVDASPGGLRTSKGSCLTVCPC
jgi:hypothetical protein